MSPAIVFALAVSTLALTACDRPEASSSPDGEVTKAAQGEPAHAAAEPPATDSPAVAADDPPADDPPAAPAPLPVAPPLPDDPAAAAAKLVDIENPTLTMQSVTSDGQRMMALTCKLTKHQLMGGMALVGAIAERKDRLTACAPTGDVAVVHWTLGEQDAAAIDVTGAMSPSVPACVAKAMAGIQSPLVGKCGVVLLLGEDAGADEALARALPTSGD